MTSSSPLPPAGAGEKLICIGNSITRHAPNADLGWYGDYGMAASAGENDYAHRLSAKLGSFLNVPVALQVLSLVNMERSPAAFDAGAALEGLDAENALAVIRLGENVPDESLYEAYIAAYGRLIDALRQKGAGRIFAVGNFWQRDDLDALTADLAKEKGIPFVSLKACQGETFQAIGQFAHAGVAAHPSDAGMAAIADTILFAMCKAGVVRGAVPCPVPEDEPKYSGCRVTVDGREATCLVARVSAIPFNTVWPGHQRPLSQTETAPFVSFICFGETELCVETEKDPQKVVIRPLSKEIVPHIEDKRIRFKIPGPGQYSLEVNGRSGNLHIFADPLSLDPAAYTATRRFEPGVHRLKERIRLKSGESLYIAPGAVVYGELEATDADNVRVFGGGILDGSGAERHTADCDMQMEGLVHFTRCTNVRMEGITLRDSCMWTATAINCRNVEYRNVKVIGMWRYNSDGFDFVNSANVHVTDCFLRTFDDTVVLKGLCLGDRTVEKQNVENCLIERCVLWCDWGGAMEVGAETVCDEYVNVAWKNCDIIRTDQGAMRLHCGDRAYVHNVSYEDIRVEYAAGDPESRYQHSDDLVYDPGNVPAHDPVLRFSLDCGMWSPDNIPGQIRDVTVQNIRVYLEEGVPAPALSFTGWDAGHTIERVRIVDYRVNGTPTMPEVHMNTYVSDVTVKIG